MAEGVVDIVRILSVLARELGVTRQADHVDTDRRVAEFAVADSGARFLVLLTQANTEFVMAAGGTIANVAWRGEVKACKPSFVCGHAITGVVASLAANTHEVFLQLADSPRQDQPHACVAGVERVHVAVTEGVLLKWEGAVGAVGLEAKGRQRDRGEVIANFHADVIGGNHVEWECDQTRVAVEACLSGHHFRDRVANRGEREDARAVNREGLNGGVAFVHNTVQGAGQNVGP